jgi:BirA family biotin operon repressor/biotin-[acetyl-CoA-carboxylase] ligase
MDCATRLAEAGAPSGTVVVADFQRQGRGTHGRVWQAPPGTCLMFTCLFRPQLVPAELSSLPARVAEDVAAGLMDATGVQSTIKLPNDVVVGGRKLCGVLCTSRITGEQVDWLLCGIGVNTSMTEDQRPLESATSLFIEGVNPLPDHPALLKSLLDRLAWLL